jgi:hypothetical protein
MTTFVKLYVQGESSKMPVVYDRFGTNGLSVHLLPLLFFYCRVQRIFHWHLMPVHPTLKILNAKEKNFYLFVLFVFGLKWSGLTRF